MLDRRQLLASLGATAATLALPRRAHAQPPGELVHLQHEVEGVLRDAWLWIPDTVRGNQPVPLVLGLHGGFGSAEDMYARFGWAEILAEHRWIGLFPNTGQQYEPDPGDADQPYLDFLLDEVVPDTQADLRRVHVTGFSGGGRKAYWLAARRSDRVAAVGVVAANMGDLSDDDDPIWSPVTHDAQPVSILHLHGERDEVVYLEGGSQGRDTVPMLDGLQLWADHMDAELADDPELPPILPDRVRALRWVADSGHEVLGLVDPPLDHRWPEYATPTLMAFFERVPRSS